MLTIQIENQGHMRVMTCLGGCLCSLSVLVSLVVLIGAVGPEGLPNNAK